MQADKTIALLFALLLTGAAALLGWRALHARPMPSAMEGAAMETQIGRASCRERV